jgi:hypothetical protein
MAQIILVDATMSENFFRVGSKSFEVFFLP